MTGAMMKAVRNRQNLTIIMLGWVCWVPSAERRNESTTTMRVNEVTMIRIAGATDRTVISATI